MKTAIGRRRLMGLLQPGSVVATLRSLEEARLKGAPAGRRDIREALDWIARRYGIEGGERGLFAPTEADRGDPTPLFTGEPWWGGSHTGYVVGFESARALVLWERTDDWPVAEAFAGIRDKWRTGAPRIGYYCCPGCTVARWRSLCAGQPTGWQDVIVAGLRRLADTPLRDDGTWGGRSRGYPFYYTLLALSELPFEDVEAERRRVQPAAEAHLQNMGGDNPGARFRRRALEWAVGEHTRLGDP
jgi:hypothetical protein